MLALKIFVAVMVLFFYYNLLRWRSYKRHCNFEAGLIADYLARENPDKFDNPAFQEYYMANAGLWVGASTNEGMRFAMVNAALSTFCYIGSILFAIISFFIDAYPLAILSLLVFPILWKMDIASYFTTPDVRQNVDRSILHTAKVNPRSLSSYEYSEATRRYKEALTATAHYYVHERGFQP